MHRTYRLAAALAAALLAGSASAQTIADFERIDTNKDGVVTVAEFEAARRRDFDLLDTNKDGFLSRAEFIRPNGVGAELVRLRERHFAEIDANKDGRISREEYLAHGRRQFAVLDRDGDGRVTRAEFEAALAGTAPAPSSGRPLAEPPPIERPVRRAPGPRPPADDRQLRAAFDQIDRNRDGFISPAELDAARLEAFQQMDANGDRRLTRQEIIAARGEAAAARFDELDANKDGVISRLEYLAAGRAMFRAADTNGDGRLSWEEFRRIGER